MTKLTPIDDLTEAFRREVRRLGGDPDDRVSVARAMQSEDFVLRIVRVCRHDALFDDAAQLLRQYTVGRRASGALLAQVAKLETLAAVMDAEPHVVRDAARQAGTCKPRPARHPEIDEWIAGKLRRDPAAKAPALYHSAPEWITKNIKLGGFGKRMTAARKLRT